MTGKYLITTDGYFFAPDGKQYRAVWGDVQILPDTFLGVQTNRNSSNWFARVGSEEQHVILAGCQIHYAVKVEQCPNVEDVQERVGDNHGMKMLDSRIYVPVEADIPETVKGKPEETPAPEGRSEPQVTQTIYANGRETQQNLRILTERILRRMRSSPINVAMFNDLLNALTPEALETVSRVSYFDKADALHVDIYAPCGGIKKRFHFSLP